MGLTAVPMGLIPTGIDSTEKIDLIDGDFGTILLVDRPLELNLAAGK